ncbi:uncharacterized protein [Choristoneura fumiferana]|uniref:uncharacterized protein n=1 Tax=Choristoneura fumiferana TaxID=7141 RepID=UPI003D15BA2F
MYNKMLKFKVFLLTLSFIAVQSNRRPPSRRFPLPIPKLPASLDSDLTDQLRIPNKAFCDKMESQPMDSGKILPWWTDYCQRLREKQEKKRLKDGVIDLSPYRRVLDKLKQYRLKEKSMPRD